MGVRGLTTFIKRHETNFFQDFQLRNTKLIIDGSNLLFFLHRRYNKKCVYGGNYDNFYTGCTEFFNTLLKCNVTPVVVFDGADDPDRKKLDTTWKRLDKHYQDVKKWKMDEVLPVLSKITLCQVLVDLKIAHMACIYEADREIAVLAKKWNCPVLSNDSDFYVYSLNGGSISISYKDQVEPVPTDNAGNYCLPVKLYKRKNVLKELFDMEHDEYDIMFPVFATLVGNDYFDPSGMTLKYPDNPQDELPPDELTFVKGIIDPVVKWLLCAIESGITTLEEISNRIPDDKREQFETSVNLYRDINTFSAFDLEACYNDNNAHHREPEDIILKDRSGHQLPFWFVRNAIKCKMVCSFILNITQNHRLVFKAQAELITMKSSFECSKRIRDVIYRLVLTNKNNYKSEQGIGEIDEYHRKSSERLQVKPNESLEGFSKLPCLESIREKSEIERKAIVFATFGASLTSFEDDIDTGSQLLILMLSLWVEHSNAPECHLHALIIGMIALHIVSPTGPKDKQCQDILKAIRKTNEKTLEEFRRRMEKHFSANVDMVRQDINTGKLFIHNVSQFQAVYLHTWYLNQLLLSPVCIPSPSVILNSTFAYNMFHLLEQNVKPKEILCGEEPPLYRLFTDWIEEVENRNVFSEISDKELARRLGKLSHIKRSRKITARLKKVIFSQNLVGPLY